MKWKAIGHSVIGTSHIQSGKTCEDSVSYKIISKEEQEVLICCVSDGAGSAKYAADASSHVTRRILELAAADVTADMEIGDGRIIFYAEQLYDELAAMAGEKQVEINEYSCTLLGCILYGDRSVFFQIGDGALIMDDGSGTYVTVWWPQNGEYSNTTNFLIDNVLFPNLQIKVSDQKVDEIAITTDGLQMLILSNETRAVHQPFFTDLFKYLRMASKEEDINTLNRRLTEYLSSDKINNRTDDDKTLFLSTRLRND